MSQPNIIYIVAHDLGRMLGCYGRGFKSPNLDRFAKQGALFNKTFCTTTACSPSRGCAWTGYGKAWYTGADLQRGRLIELIDGGQPAVYEFALAGILRYARRRSTRV